MSVKIHINGTPFEMDESLIVTLMEQTVPEFMRDSDIPPPDATGDIIRGAIKSMLALTLKKLLFNIYGAAAPQVPKRADKLKYAWPALCDFVIAKMKGHHIEVGAEEISDGQGYRLFSAIALPLSADNPGEVAESTPDGCDECYESRAEAGSTN